MRVIIILIGILMVQIGSAQELKNLRHTTTSNYKCDFYVTFSEKKVKYEDTLHYYWFKAQKIHVTQGSSEGYLLHGSFTKFYHSGQLAEQGRFDKGLKDGQWKQWYESGNLMSIYNYREGELSGDYALYNENGDIRESGKIRKGEKDVDQEKESWWQRRKKIKKALKPESEKDKRTEERKQKREKKKKQRKERKEREGWFFKRLFNKMGIKKKEKNKKKKD
ncbi:MAG: hypothetical protein HUJ25_17900 [Crocinitomicaceae bacterium]|nr:hypothetical protein [Crocinitomicaceae bacterium]